MKQVIEYKTNGTCCQLMQVVVEDDIVADVNFMGGCNGNLKGIKNLIKGMKIDDVIERLSGITCGPKSTSCPDQLAVCLSEYKAKNISQTVG